MNPDNNVIYKIWMHNKTRIKIKSVFFSNKNGEGENLVQDRYK